MVLLHFRNDVETQFILQATTDESIDAVTRRLVQMHNARLRLLRLTHAVEDVARAGPIALDDEGGVAEAAGSSSSGGRGKGKGIAEEEDSDDEAEASGEAVSSVARVGVAPPAQIADLLVKVAMEGRDAIAPQLAEQRVPLQIEALVEAEERIKGALVIAFGDGAVGLPEADPVRLILDHNEVLDGTNMAKLVFDPDEAVLWWANKQLTRADGAVLADYIGTNEKTKLKVKVRRNASMGAPPRDPPLSEDERKNMLAYWYKRQEEEKAMAEDDEDSYLASDWANPNSLRKQLTGVDIAI